MTDGWESRLRDALPPVAGRARSLRKAHVNPYHKALMSLCDIEEDETALKYALFRAQNGAEGVKNSLVHHLFYPLLKIVSPGVITPKTPHSPGPHPGHIPPLPFHL